jgi:hypothetical protein
MQQSRSERQSHLTRIIATPAGRLYVLSEYRLAAEMPVDTSPQGAMSFPAMIEIILNKEFAVERV